jgi:GNAT superfamily N-acetyltransferase
MVSILRTASEHEDFRALVRLLDADLSDRYGVLQAEYDRHNVVDALQTVVVAYVDQRPAGCGALRPYDRETGEIKRMYVRPAFRGWGIGGHILRELEAWAGELGLVRAILETGRKQHAAIGLYQKHGYRRIENYGPYADQPMSVCYEKALDDHGRS